MAVAWPQGVRKRVLRDSTWEIPISVIADETRCGRKKVRPSATLQPDTFNVSMNFTYEEYVIFKYWFKNILRKGALTFMYPAVDAINGQDVEYRFVPGSSISPDNPGGKIVHVPMQWEEV